ncbi:hypothetical protein AK812_SmicGene3630 [Symbiodinium microadriaticum]|uniref:Uncharacterized protein n=1 Tax=Symbiodinium microadriaticum TaxID=2951 RepID=A0A1Q9EY88_SYMMI|nr:hypothetical protein AK812_SmicGene3630 [Symbiodinium microadriaticum]
MDEAQRAVQSCVQMNQEAFKRVAKGSRPPQSAKEVALRLQNLFNGTPTLPVEYLAEEAGMTWQKPAASAWYAETGGDARKVVFRIHVPARATFRKASKMSLQFTVVLAQEASAPSVGGDAVTESAKMADIRSRFPIGGRCALLPVLQEQLKPAGSIIMREGEDLNSKEVQKLRASSAGGTFHFNIPSLPQEALLKVYFLIVDMGVEVRDAAGVSGWVSVISNSGQELLHPRTAWLSLASMDGGDVEAAQHALSELRRAHLAAQHGGDLAAELLCAHAASAERLARLQLAEEEAREQVQESSKLHQAEAMKAKIAGLEVLWGVLGLQGSRRRMDSRSRERDHGDRAISKSNKIRRWERYSEDGTKVDVLRLRLEAQTFPDLKAVIRRFVHAGEQSLENAMRTDAQQGQNLHRGEARRAHEEVEAGGQAFTSPRLKVPAPSDFIKASRQQRRVLTMTEHMEEEEEQEHRALQSTAEVASAQEEQTKQELREAVLLRSEASQAADEALALRAKLSREDEATQKLETAMVELDRARQLTQELNRDKAEAAKELAEAATAAARAGEVKEALLLVSEALTTEESACSEYRVDKVERCYAAPPGGDQLKCSKVVDAYVPLCTREGFSSCSGWSHPARTTEVPAMAMSPGLVGRSGGVTGHQATRESDERRNSTSRSEVTRGGRGSTSLEAPAKRRKAPRAEATPEDDSCFETAHLGRLFIAAQTATVEWTIQDFLAKRNQGGGLCLDGPKFGPRGVWQVFCHPDGRCHNLPSGGPVGVFIRYLGPHERVPAYATIESAVSQRRHMKDSSMGNEVPTHFVDGGRW